jgi:hypothetical protein
MHQILVCVDVSTIKKITDKLNSLKREVGQMKQKHIPLTIKIAQMLFSLMTIYNRCKKKHYYCLLHLLEQSVLFS